MSRILIKFHWDRYRHGTVNGLFVTTPEQLEAAFGKKVYFGEILGKHSEVYGNLEREDIVVKSNDQTFIDKLVDVVGSETISGYNPLRYIEDEE